MGVLDGESAVESLGKWLGKPAHIRTTLGDERLLAAHVLANQMDRRGFKGMKELDEAYIDGRASEAGWDTQKRIEMIEAASSKFSMPAKPEPEQEKL